MERDEASFEEKIGMSNGAEVCLGEARLNKAEQDHPIIHVAYISKGRNTRVHRLAVDQNERVVKTVPFTPNPRCLKIVSLLTTRKSIC